MKKELEDYNWHPELHDLPPQQMLGNFYSVCENICEKYVPKKSLTFSKDYKPPRERKLLIRRRRKVNNQLRTNLKNNRTLKLRQELVNIEKQLQVTYRKSLLEKEHKAAQAIKNNSKYFFNYAKRFSKVKTTIGPLIKGRW